jgi:hypothetical protein
MNIVAVVVSGFVAILLFSFLTSRIIVEAQVPDLNKASGIHTSGVRIISPKANTTVPVGPLTIYGISSDTPQTNCKVYVDWNDLKPMQNVTAKGPTGSNDYSNWTYTYAPNYHLITPGINELTSKITCFDNPGNLTNKYYSVNITGVGK